MEIVVRPQSNTGHLELEPTDPNDRDEVRKSNQYDGTCIAYLQDIIAIEDFLCSLTEEEAKEIEKGYTTKVYLDGHTFKHMVGGQSD